MTTNTNKTTWYMSPMIWLALICVGGFAYMAQLVMAGQSKPLDTELFGYARSIEAPWLTDLLSGITFLGGSGFLLPGGILLLIVLFIKGYRLETWTLLGTMGLGELLNEALKEWFARHRPSGVNLIELPDSMSFPSGHAMFAVVFYGFITYLLWRLMVKQAGGRAALLIISLPFIFSMGFSRVYLGVHYPSDVLAGYLVGTAWMLITIYTYQSLSAAQPAKKQQVDTPPLPN
ncbi:phosphatase PAP2 family protein [Brevibacillus dissolubilis]|uniref:phosphatase PAP2 family protein n=1 Tax=Brevibacillus dissolubilis TaxID=1844116 RepID=UPI001117905B|nr:phosphatase PAP2 family protein [Brevibacillus dissolubilis]